MKFYKDNFYYKIIFKKLNAVYSSFYYVKFFKNGMLHNSRNAAYITNYKQFYLNGICYFDDFTKHSWRKFSKLQAFL